MARTGGSCGTILARESPTTTGEAVIRLSGEHDTFTADALSEAIARATAAGDGDLVVDLRDVEFMAVATVRVILQAQQLLRRQSRSVVLRSPSSCAKRVLDLCGAADLFEPCPVVGGGP